MKRRLILSSVVGGLEVDSENISQLVSGWQDKIYSCPGTIDVEQAIKVHLLVLRAALRNRCVHVSPLHDEISECL
jgi:hypothetical protein